MVHRSMKDGSSVADELYIKRVLIVLEGFLFFSLYSFSCIAKQVTTLKQLRLLSCLDFLETNFEHLVLFFDITLVSPISPTPDPARYTLVTTKSIRDPEISPFLGFEWVSSPSVTSIKLYSSIRFSNKVASRFGGYCGSHLSL